MAALFFLRFHRKYRLFLFFTAAFLIPGVNRLLFLTLFGGAESEGVTRYIIRLAAFVLILFAIIDKNRRPRVAPPGAPSAAQETARRL